MSETGLPLDVPAEIWNIIADAALTMRQRPLFSERASLVQRIVDGLAAAGYTVADSDDVALGRAVREITADWVVVDEIYRRAGLDQEVTE